MINYLGWILSFLMACAISFAFILQINSSNMEKAAILNKIDDCNLQMERRFELSNDRWNDLLKNLSLPKVSPDKYSNAPEPSEPRMAATGENITDPATIESVLPDGNINEIMSKVDAQSLAHEDLDEVLINEYINPQRKKLDRLENAQAQLELARAQEKLKVLDCEILLEAAKGIESLRNDGSYIEYAPGENYQTIEGIMTGAEIIPSGTRMFYFYPERFSELYVKKETKEQAAQDALRNIYRIINK
jgi:hypothetical protein